MNSDILSPISAQSTLADIVTSRLREAIIRGNLQPGERLAEPALATELGVSRSPVREALVRLESERLVWRESNRGFYVWAPTETDVSEILSLRVMMESLAAELIIDDLTDEDFAKLEAMHAHQREIVEANRYLQLTRADRQFHDFFVERSGNSRLMDLWAQVMSQWEVLIYKRVERHPYVSETVLTDHRNIISVMQERDLERVIKLHREINKRVELEMKMTLQELRSAAA